jgi:cytochrome c553
MDRASFKFFGAFWMRFSSIVLVALLALCSIHPATADSIEEKAAVCAGCHGENGKPISPEIPVLWGQKEGYIYLQLRDLKRGDRKNEVMTGIAAGLEKTDMQELAKYFSEKPWTNLQQKSADNATATQAQTVAASAQCEGCHLSGYLGDSTIPRIAGQSEAYMLKTMTEFRSGERANNAWMVTLLKSYTESDIAALSKYIAGL